jgi:hypothetical protein
VGTFQIVGGAKQGGNVAAYFCRPDGTVLHVIAGPVSADVLLREARWVVETHNLAVLQCGTSLARWMALFRKSHLERLRLEHQLDPRALRLPFYGASPAGIAPVLQRAPAWNQLDRQAQVHYLLASYPMVKIERIYAVVFEAVLNEKVSTVPVARQ